MEPPTDGDIVEPGTTVSLVTPVSVSESVAQAASEKPSASAAGMMRSVFFCMNPEQRHGRSAGKGRPVRPESSVAPETRVTTARLPRPAGRQPRHRARHGVSATRARYFVLVPV